MVPEAISEGASAQETRKDRSKKKNGARIMEVLQAKVTLSVPLRDFKYSFLCWQAFRI
jgi:hypothetical protein